MVPGPWGEGVGTLPFLAPGAAFGLLAVPRHDVVVGEWGRREIRSGKDMERGWLG